MKIADAKKLHSGDQVYWNDPDDGACSRVLTIQSVEVHGNVVTIEEPDGSVVECFARELQAGLPAKRPTLWDNNEIQFARLLCELVANCDNLEFDAVCASMDLSKRELMSLYDRANLVWERAKAKHCPPPSPAERAEDKRKSKLAARIEAEAKAGNPLFKKRG